MNFSFKTRSGLQNLLNVISMLIMTAAAAWFGWDSSPPVPLPDVTVIEQFGVTGAGDSAPLYSIIGFDTELEARQAATKIKEPADSTGAVTGMSFAAILALINLILSFFGRGIETPEDLNVISMSKYKAA